ncbi:MAG TPA: hypothetical protein PK020_10355 [Ilumatobacteraceae bacterium]|nr:hypothetical protein [Ilumatobacteraceae bacterium]HRB02524.1 hypothetical protein [Ilumatobacteraceae bacterium]
MFDFEGVPVTLAMGTPVVDGWEEGVPDRAAAAGLVDHIGVQLSKYLPELCQHDVSELFGSLQLTRSTGYEAVCAAHPLVVATERTDAPDEAERVLVAALTAVESGDREAFAALLDSDAQYLAEDPGFTFESSLHASDRYDCTMNGSVVDCYPLDTMVGFFISSVGNSWLITGIYSTESGE